MKQIVVTDVEFAICVSIVFCIVAVLIDIRALMPTVVVLCIALLTEGNPIESIINSLKR